MIYIKTFEEKISNNVYKVYHGTNNDFKTFDIKKSTQGIIWFTDDINTIINNEHGGMGNKYILTRYITINNPAGWDEYNKYYLGQIKQMGYDGIILPQGDYSDYIVFSNKQIKINPPKLIKTLEHLSSKNEKIKLIDIFEDYPDEDELIWQFIGSYDFEKKEYSIKEIDIDEIISNDFIENFNDNALPWQKKYIKQLIKNTTFKPIIVDLDEKIIIDGNHRLMAMYLAGIKKIKIVDINEN